VRQGSHPRSGEKITLDIMSEIKQYLLQGDPTYLLSLIKEIEEKSKGRAAIKDPASVLRNILSTVKTEIKKAESGGEQAWKEAAATILATLAYLARRRGSNTETIAQLYGGYKEAVLALLNNENIKASYEDVLRRFEKVVEVVVAYAKDRG